MLLFVFSTFWGCCIPHGLSLYVKSSVVMLVPVHLSLSCVPTSWAPSQDIFPPECLTHVGSMSVSSRPSPHHHHTLDALRLPLQRAAWRHQWVLLLRSQSPYVSPFVVVCRDLWFIALKALDITFPSLSVSVNLLCGQNPNGWNLIFHAPHPHVRFCGGSDASGEVCAGHCLWDGFLTHTWTHDPPPLSQQQECYGKKMLWFLCCFLWYNSSSSYTEMTF